MRSAGYFSKTKASFALLTSDRLLPPAAPLGVSLLEVAHHVSSENPLLKAPRTSAEDSGTPRQDRIGRQRCRNRPPCCV